MKSPKASSEKIRLPRKNAGLAELADFFDRHDGADLFDQGITAVDRDKSDLDQMLMRREAMTPSSGRDTAR